MGIKITVLSDVMPCRSVERLHVSNQSLNFIFRVTILLKGDNGAYRLHNIFVVASIRVKVVVILNFCFCQETAIRGK